MENTDGTQAKRLRNTVDWLEETVQQNNQRFTQLQQQLEQAMSLLRAQGERLVVLEEANRTGNAHMPRVSRLEEELRQVRERLGQLTEEQSKHTEQYDQLMRMWQADSERHHKTIVSLEHRGNDVAKELDVSNTRVRALDEAGKRQQESLQQLVQVSHDLRNRGDAIESRIMGGADQVRRNELELARLAQELGTLEKKDGIIEGRVQLLVDLIKRLEEQQTMFQGEEAARRELAEQLEVQRVEQVRLSTQNTEISQRNRENAELLTTHTRQLSQLELTFQNITNQLNQFRQQLEDFRERTIVTLNNLAQMDAEQRRRQIMELEQQVREIREHALRSFGGNLGGGTRKIS